jgi:hypothetical protein
VPQAVRRTDFCVSWPYLGLCPSFLGGHFFWTTLKEKIPAGLDPVRDFAMMNLAYRIFHGASPMTVPETISPPQQMQGHLSRRRHVPDDYLVLSELNPRMVIDHLDDEELPLHVLSFGSVREVCPKCQTPHLKLVLRQQTVRVAHLFCAECESCFDAHYPNGTPALTI